MTLCSSAKSNAGRLGFALALAVAVAPLTQAMSATFLPNFNAATFSPGAPVNNPYFPLTNPLTHFFEAQAIGDDEPSTERFELTNLGVGPTLLGVQTSVQLDRAFEDGLLIEETRDYYAQDTQGNVWYFGEDVTSFTYDKNGRSLLRPTMRLTRGRSGTRVSPFRLSSASWAAWSKSSRPANLIPTFGGSNITRPAMGLLWKKKAPATISGSRT